MYNPIREVKIMEVDKLQIKLIRGYEGCIRQDGRTQKNKILPYLSIVYPYQGYHEVAVEDEPFVKIMKESDCFLVAPQVRHTIIHRLEEGDDAMRPRWMFLTVLYHDLLDVTAWFHPPLRLTGEAALPFRSAIDELLTEPNAFAKMRIAGTVLEALLSVSEFLPQYGQLDSIYPALMLIRDRYDGNLSVEELAKSCGMSPAAFYRAFRKATDKTPMQYLNERRLTLAAQLLTEGQTLSQIAARCGFCDEFHLSRNFKNFYGVSPREYKKQTVY